LSGAHRPARVAHGPLYARPVRGPDDQGRWYWRVERADGAGGRVQCATGWWHPSAVGLALTRIEAGLCPTPSPSLTIRDLLELYLGHKVEAGTVTALTLAGHRVCARRIVAVLGSTPCATISQGTVAAYVSERLRTPVARASAAHPRRCAAPSSVQLEINLLRAAWKWAQTVGAIPPAHPFPATRVAGARGGRRLHVNNQRTPTASEVEVVERWFVEKLPAWLALMFRLLARTACRAGEISELQWSAFNPQTESITVDGKTGPRQVPLVPKVAAYLHEARHALAPRPDDRIFPIKSAKSNFAHKLRDACAACEVPRFSPHGLRRYGVVELYRRGADPSVAAAITGHSPQVALTYYRQVRFDEARAAMLNTFAPSPPAQQDDSHKTGTTKRATRAKTPPKRGS
jgi:integrase